jgi:hypothetical protein
MLKKSFFVSLALAAAVLSVRADVIPTLISPTAEGSAFRWNYNTNVTIDQMIMPGDYFTIYDFGSLVPGSNLQPANWAFSSSLLGITPATVLPQDDANVFNLTWTYTGTAPIDGQAFLGVFSVLSDTNQLRTDNFAGHATRSNGANAGTKIDNIGLVGVPVPEMSALAPIIGLCGLAAIGYVSSLLRRRQLA